MKSAGIDLGRLLNKPLSAPITKFKEFNQLKLRAITSE